MARAYVCFARNDLADNALQVLDLRPNTSLRVPAYEGEGQTGYLTHLPQNNATATTAGVGGLQTTNAAYAGLAAYLLDNVENIDAVGNNKSLTAANANTIAAALLTRVSNGLALALANINAAIRAVTGGANSDLNGAVVGSWSTGTVEEVLRILSGEVYRLPAASQVANAAGAFPGHGAGHVRLGGFLAVGAAGYRNFRLLVDTGELHLSALSGVLSKLKAATYTWLNPAMTYGAGGTATTVGGVAIAATGIARAVVIFDVAGAVI